MSTKAKSTALYPHPFSKAYWRDAAAELKDTKMLVFAALMIALRVALKLVAIPLAPNLKINTAFLANALGAMVFGPVMATLCAAVTDVLGYLINPEGIYFIPFILTEIAGSVIFALFLYRAKLSTTRVVLSRFCICFLVNVLLQTPIMMWYYSLYMGGKSYVLTIPGIIKNLFMFPIESVVLTLFLSVLQPITYRMKLTYDPDANLKFSKKQIVCLVCLFLVGVGCVGGYLNYYYQNTSLTVGYSATERVEKNHEMQTIVLEETDNWDDANSLTVIESAKKKFLGKEVTYTVAVYTADDNLEITDAMWGYKKSAAAGDENLTRAATATILVNDNTGEVLSFSVKQE